MLFIYHELPPDAASNDTTSFRKQTAVETELRIDARRQATVEPWWDWLRVGP